MPRPALDRAKPQLVRVAGRRAWYIRWTQPGTRRSQVVSTAIPHNKGDHPSPEALEALDNFNAALDAPPADPVISHLLDSYLKNRRGCVVAYQRLVDAAAPLKRHLGCLRPDQLTAVIQKNYTQRRRRDGQSCSTGTIRKELGMLRAALNLGQREKWIAGPPPRIDLPANPPPRERLMTRAAGQKLLAAAFSMHLRLFIMIGLASGSRKSAILDLTWDRVDLERGIIDFRNPDRQATKKKRGIVPIGGRLIAALSDARRLAQTDRVIEFNGHPVKDIKHAFHNAAVKAHVAWATPHAMKHSVISWLAEDGFTVDQISDLTDTDPATVRRIYRKINPAALRPMAEALEKNLFVPTPLAQTR